MLRQIAKKIIVAIIRLEAKLVLRKYRPKIVGITGSVGKTGTKEAVAKVLASRFNVRKSPKSFNSELGVPLTILDCENAWYSLGGWIRNILEGLSLILFRSDYPEWLVLEVGIDRPGDIQEIIKWVPFDMVILTRLPEVAVHIEFFKTPEALAKEKLFLARAIGPAGTVILNFDDPKIMSVANELKGRVMTYGWGEGATVRGSNERLMYYDNGEERLPDGLSVRVDYQGNTMPIRIKGMLAHHQLYGVLAAVAAGLALDINLVDIATALANFETPPGRFKLLPGLKNSLIIDDSYNASPAAVEAALKVLGEIETKGQKIAVLADMMELGNLTVEAHRAVGAQAAEVCDLLITVGLRAKFISDEAGKRGMNKKHLLHFDTVGEAALAVQDLLKPQDIILVKGSQAMRLEKAVEEIMAHPEEKEKLLVRQEEEWKDKL